MGASNLKAVVQIGGGVVNDAEQTSTSGEETETIHAETVRCYNRRYSFELKRDTGKKEFSIVSFDENKSADQSTAVRGMVQWLSVYLDAPCSLYVNRMSEFLANERFSISGVSEVRNKDKKMLKVEFEVKAAPKLAGFVGWFIVSPEESWVLHSYEILYKTNDYIRGTIDYDGSEGGVPRPMKVVHTKGKVGEAMPVQTTSFDFDEFHFGEVPEFDFTLAAFGLPELSESRRAGRGVAPAAWMAIAAFSMLAIAVGLKVLLSRGRRAEPAK